MRKDTRRFVALVMVLCMLTCLVPTVGTRAEESASYTSEVDVTLYVGQFATYEQTAASTQQETEINSTIATADVESVTSVYDAQLAADSSDTSYTGDYTNLENALYTFTGSDSSYTIYNETAGVYLSLSSAGYPGKNSSDTITITSTGTEGEFYLYSSSNSRYLVFNRSGNNYFDRQTVSDSETCAFLIYRPITTGEDGSTELPGYIRVTNLDSISSGSQYLIVAVYSDTYYVLYPSTSTSSKYAHVARALGKTITETDYTVTFTGVAAGTTSMVVGDVKYNITVLETKATGDATLAGGEATTLSISTLDSDFVLGDGSMVVWSVDDTDIAGLYDTDGASTSLVAHAEGKTNVIAKVYDASGNVTAVYVWTITVTSTYGSGDYTFTWTVTETVYNGTLYYSVDGGELVEATPYDVVTDSDGNTIRYYNITYASENVKNTGFIYCIKPDEGYVVTYVYDDKGNSYSQFYGAETLQGYYTKEAFLSAHTGWTHKGGWPTDAMSNAEWDALLAQAIAAGCQAVYWNTRNLSNNGYDSFIYTNYCDKLPTVDKVITSLTRIVSGETTTISYVEGETEVQVDDVINYTITVTTYKEKADITYSNVTLTDTMKSGSGYGATFTDNNSNTIDVTSYVNYEATQSDASKEAVSLTVTYTVTTRDLDSQILNTVALTYDYETEYSTGSYGGTASAVASVNLSTFDPDDIVIDFGLPVTIDYSSLSLSGDSAIDDTGTANATYYGKVSVNGSKVTYTPTSVLTGVDTVTLYSVGGAYATFNVYPATTVYYEEGFADYGTGWSVDDTISNGWSTTDNKGTTEQEAQVAGDKTAAVSAATGTSDYNYDEAYADDTTGSENTAAKTTTVADSLSFTFTGTGVDIFANCDSGSGMVAIRVVDNSDNSIKKLLFVDTKNTGDYSSGDGTTAYNTPIASVSGLNHGSYTVTIYLVTVNSSGFKFDGFRVYDTIANDTTDTESDAYTVQTSVYQTDDEDYPVYYELRDQVLYGLDVDTSSSTYTEDIDKGVAQVYATSGTSSAIVVYDSSSSVLVDSDTNAQSLLDNGPKNELYLYAGGSVVFKITTSREVQIGMRSVTGANVSYTVKVTESTGTISSTENTCSISSSVDMFYDLVEKSSDSTEYTYTITITNNIDSSGVLSITDIKVSDSNDGDLFEELTAEDLVAALTGEAEEPITYADATLTVNLTDYTGSVIATAALTENGVEGEETTFAASDILAAVEEVLPTGYALVSADDIADQTVVYGENGSLSVQIGKVATLTVTYQKYTGLFRKTTVATATLTKVQTDRSSWATFSVSEIRATVPAGYRVLLITSASVNYGTNGSKTIICY